VAEIAADARLFEKHRHNVKASWRRVHRMHGCSRTRVTSTQERHARVCPSRWWTFTSAWVAWWRPGAEMRETSKQQCQCGARCQSQPGSTCSLEHINRARPATALPGPATRAHPCKHLASSHRATQRHAVTSLCCVHEQDAEATSAVRPSPRTATMDLHGAQPACRAGSGLRAWRRTRAPRSSGHRARPAARRPPSSSRRSPRRCRTPGTRRPPGRPAAWLAHDKG